MGNKNEMCSGVQRKKFTDLSVVITAKEAREKTETAIRIKDESYLAPVYNKISDACREGLFTVDFIGELSDSAINRLKELGYECKRIGLPHPMDEEFAPNGVRISW